MSSKINVLDSEPIELNICPLFTQYYNNPNSYISHIIEKEINNNHYSDCDFLNIFKNKDAVVIDGGANIGLFSIYLHKVCKQIFAVEPTNEHMSVLKQMCKLLNINNIKFSSIAFNNYIGKCNFQNDEGNTTTNRIASFGNLEVQCSTILHYIKNCGYNKVDLLKLDIEGGEYFAVLSDSTFKSVAEVCSNIYIEIHPPFVSSEQFINLFQSMGYKTKFINSEHLNNNLNILAYT